MSDLLIRGLPPRTKKEMEEIAKEEDLSLNQLVVRLLRQAIDQKYEKEEEAERHREAFRRLDELRERIRKKYGKFDESWKLIREDRDSR